jgi:hypothetical protein
VLLGRLLVGDRVGALRAALSRNELLVEVPARAAKLNLPGWYLTAGCVFQTVWNAVTGRPPTAGIRDYDLFYFDDSDLGWDAENEVIQAGERVFGDLAVDVEIRNEFPCAGGTSTRRTALPTCSTSSSGATRCSHRAACTRPKPKRWPEPARQRNVTDLAAWPVRPE